MNFGGKELNPEQLKHLRDMFQNPEFQNLVNTILDQASKFPVVDVGSGSLDGQLWEVWSNWRRGTKKYYDVMPMGFYAGIILGLLAIILCPEEMGVSGKD